MKSLRRIYEIVSEAVLETTGAGTLKGNTEDAVLARAVLVRTLLDEGLTKNQISILSEMSIHTVKKHSMAWPEKCRSSKMYRHFRLEVRNQVHETVQELMQQSEYLSKQRKQ